MSNEIFVKMWNILKENDFKIDTKIKSEIICTSCTNILTKPCIIPCGCRYCHDCLISYLNGEEKFCLGQSDDCKREFINFDTNVFNDQAINIKISRIIVKCPLGSCEFNTELGKMENHMRICDKQPVTCPYYAIGCEDNKIDVDKMKIHFDQENYFHARLLMDFVDNWKNNIKSLENNMLNLQEEKKCTNKAMESKQKAILVLEENAVKLLKENRSLKEHETAKFNQNNQIEEIILTLQMKSKEQNDEIEKNKKKLDKMEINQEQMKTTIEKITQENKSFREELEIIELDKKVKEEIISALLTKSQEKESKRVKLKHKLFILNVIFTILIVLLMEKNIVRLLQDKNQLEEIIWTLQTKMESELRKIKEKCEFLKVNLKMQMDTRMDKYENAMKILETKLTQIQANQNSNEFLWRIQNWEEKKERARNGIEKFIVSDPFYSHKNGYKMALALYPYNEGTHLSLFINIMQGEFDNILPWPFRHEVKLDLLNQETGMAHMSRKVGYEASPTAAVWKKPTSEINTGHGYPQFIKLSELSSNLSLCQDNQIWIKATLEIKNN